MEVSSAMCRGALLSETSIDSTALIVLPLLLHVDETLTPCPRQPRASKTYRLNTRTHSPEWLLPSRSRKSPLEVTSQMRRHNVRGPAKGLRQQCPAISGAQLWRLIRFGA